VAQWHRPVRGVSRFRFVTTFVAINRSPKASIFVLNRSRSTRYDRDGHVWIPQQNMYQVRPAHQRGRLYCDRALWSGWRVRSNRPIIGSWLYDQLIQLKWNWKCAGAAASSDAMADHRSFRWTRTVSWLASFCTNWCTRSASITNRAAPIETITSKSTGPTFKKVSYLAKYAS